MRPVNAHLSRNQHRRLTLWAVLALAILITGAGCESGPQGPRPLTEAALDDVRSSLSLGSSGLASLRVYFDVSTSMRGFSLAANGNERGAGDEFRSVISALDNLPSLLSGASASNGEAAPPLSVTRFGGSLQPLPSASLLLAAMGQEAVLPISGEALQPESRSMTCADQVWSGSPAVREQIDSLYSERTTCLNVVFEEILRDPGPSASAIVITDAEQDAPIGTQSCPAPKNLGTIQSNLQAWVQRGRYVAVMVFRLPSNPWRSRLESTQYCSCQTRQLYAYLLTPSAEQAEQLFSHIASQWSGGPTNIAYLPFTARPASQFDVEMEIRKADDGAVPAVFAAEPSHFRRPEMGKLPVFAIELQEGREAELEFRVGAVGFEEGEARAKPGFFAIDRAKSPLSWQHPAQIGAGGSSPVKSLTTEGPGDATSSDTPTGIDTGLEFVQLPLSDVARSEDAPRSSRSEDGTQRRDVLSGSGADGSSSSERITRTASFRATPRQMPASDLTGLDRPFSQFRLRVSRRPGVSSGQETYLLQLDSASTDLSGQLRVALPLMQRSGSGCLAVDNVENQMRFVYRRAPVARFLLRVDY